MSKHIRVRWTTLRLRLRNANTRRAAVNMGPAPTLTAHRKELAALQKLERSAGSSGARGP